MRRTLIKNASVLTMDTRKTEWNGCDVLMEHGKIAKIGPSLAVDDAEVIDASGMIAMPGMVDNHRHVWEFIDIGRIVKLRPAPFLPAYQEWKMRTMVSMDPEDHYLAELAGGLHAIDTGVTTVVDYAHGQHTREHVVAAAQGLKDSGIAGWFAHQMGVSSSYRPGDTVSMQEATAQRIAATTEAHWQTLESLQKDLFSDASSVLQLGVAPSGNNGSEIRAIRDEWARLRGMGIRFMAMHIHQPAKPHAAGKMGHRASGIEDLHDAGLLGPDYQVVHANSLTERETDLLVRAGCMLSVTPMGEITYVLSPKKGPPIHGRAMRAGLPSGIGIDVPLAVPGDFFEHVRSAYWSLFLDAQHLDIAATVQPQDMLDLATANGAASCRLAGVTGSLTEGARADLILLRTDRIDFGRAGTLAARVATFASSQDVDSVWIAGEPRKRHGRLLGVDLQELRAKLAVAQERIASRAATVHFT